MPNPRELIKILTEFSYRDAMLDVPFKPRAYELAAEAVTAHLDELEATWKTSGVKGLKAIPGIGQSIAEKIDEFFQTGKVKSYEEMKKKFPVDIWELSQIEGLGPKHIADLYEYLKVKHLEDLKKALKDHKVRTIPRWGAKSEEKLSKQLAMMESASGRRLLAEVFPLAESIAERLRVVRGVKRVEIAGSIRRRQDTIGDIDLIVTSKDAEHVMDTFVNLPEVDQVHEHGKTRSSVRLNIGMDADLRVVPDEVFGATLQYFTGDKRHNVLLRELALSKGYTLNEYGLYKISGGKKSAKPIACRTEEEIYKRLGMDTPPPELRVGANEIDVARKHRLPILISYGSVKGDLQVQTSWTDGAATIEEMAMAAKKSGLSYIAVTDHTKALAFIHGLDEKRLAKQGREIDELNRRLKGFTILKGTECDILEDGSLDLSDAALASLDWVGVSIHSHFHLSREAQTKRILKALAHPAVNCFFHPTCRVIGKREPIEFDLDEVLATAKKNRVALEIDASPERSDIHDQLIRKSVDVGVKLVIDSDAHAPEHFSFLKFGEAMARRGWAKKSDILNTKNAKDLLAYLKKR